MNTRLRQSKDFLAGLILLLIGAGAIVVAREYPFGTAMRMGSGYFPTVLGAILVGFGVFLVARGARSKEQPALTRGAPTLASSSPSISTSVRCSRSVSWIARAS